MGVVFKGDHEPLTLYKGEKLVQKPTNLKKSGTELTFEKSYNHTAEVEVAGKSEQVQYSGKNLLNEHWLTLNTTNSPRPFVWDEAEQAYVGLPSSIVQWVLPIEWKENQRYTISAIAKRDEWDAGHNTGWGFGLHVFYVDGTYQYVGIANILEYEPTTLTTKANNTIDYIKFTYNRNYVSYVKWLQIEEGTSATTYEPYCGGIPSPNPDYPQPIESIESVELVSRGRNLLNVPKTFTQTGMKEVPCNLHAGKYTISFDSVVSDYVDVSCLVQYKTATGWVYLGTFTQGTKKYLTFTSNEPILLFGFYAANGWNPAQGHTATWSNLQIEEGSVANPYEPYHSTTRTIDLQGHQLRSLPDGTHDTLVMKRTGECWIEKRICENRIGNMKNAEKREWGLNVGKGLFWFRDTDNLSIVGTYDNLSCMSDRLLGVPTVSSSFQPNKTICLENAYQTLNVRNDDLIDMTVAEAREYMRDFVVTYPLATPQTTPLPSIEPLPTYWPTTVIYDQEGNDISAFVRVIE